MYVDKHTVASLSVGDTDLCMLVGILFASLSVGDRHVYVGWYTDLVVIREIYCRNCYVGILYVICRQWYEEGGMLHVVCS